VEGIMKWKERFLICGQERSVTNTRRGGREERNGYLSVSVAHSWWKLRAMPDINCAFLYRRFPRRRALASIPTRGGRAPTQKAGLSDENFMLDSGPNSFSGVSSVVLRTFKGVAVASSDSVSTRERK
jgi:hypothetical protein